MVKISKVVSLLSCAFVLRLGFSHAALAIQNSLTDDTTVRLPLVKKDANTSGEVHAMKGEVLRLEGDHYVVKRSDGKQVSLRMDDATQVTRTFAPGEWIEAMVSKSLMGTTRFRSS